jgi:hypothetical protein
LGFGGKTHVREEMEISKKGKKKLKRIKKATPATFFLVKKTTAKFFF